MYISQQFKECLYVYIYSIYIYSIYINIIFSISCWHKNSTLAHIKSYRPCFLSNKSPQLCPYPFYQPFSFTNKNKRHDFKTTSGGIRRFSLTHRRVPTPGSLPIILSSCISWDAKDVIIKLAPRKLIALRSSTWRRLKLLSEDSRTSFFGTKTDVDVDVMLMLMLNGAGPPQQC